MARERNNERWCNMTNDAFEDGVQYEMFGYRWCLIFFFVFCFKFETSQRGLTTERCGSKDFVVFGPAIAGRFLIAISAFVDLLLITICGFESIDAATMEALVDVFIFNLTETARGCEIAFPRFHKILATHLWMFTIRNVTWWPWLWTAATVHFCWVNVL